MLSVFDIFKIGIGPSSSHTVGPMRAAKRFALALRDQGLLPNVARVQVELLGSLGATGRGHATDLGVMLGLLGESPDTVDTATAIPRIDAMCQAGTFRLLDTHAIGWAPARDILFLGRQIHPEHPNALRLTASDGSGACLLESTYLSVGGGFIARADGEEDHGTASARQGRDARALPAAIPGAAPHPFDSGDALLARCRETGLSIAQLMRANEQAHRSDADIRAGLLHIWDVMRQSVRRGLNEDGGPFPQTLPGPARIRRRAPVLYRDLIAAGNQDPLTLMDWVDAYAMAVNEENAAGGRVVTAPTNGAAGVIPAVLGYYTRFIDSACDDGVVDFLLTAGAIGVLYKTNASISGAEVGCQGEVGVACSMAAAGLAAVLGGTVDQVENAAEVGMEHNLGLTCDPVGGRVQIPCVERNAMGAVKAINAARLALRGDGRHHVSLDTVIRTMMQTGADMKTQYKETSLGGLAVNVVEC